MKQCDCRAHVVNHCAELHPCQEENTVIFNEHLLCARATRASKQSTTWTTPDSVTVMKKNRLTCTPGCILQPKEHSLYMAEIAQQGRKLAFHMCYDIVPVRASVSITYLKWLIQLAQEFKKKKKSYLKQFN